MTSETLIEARGLSRSYGLTTAVADLNLTLAKGEVLGLLGPNGAGKTTSMKMLAGCLAPSSGQVIINGVDLRSDPKLAKRSLGYLPEQPPVYPELTVTEYLRFCAGLHGIASGQRQDAVLSAMRDCGLTQMAQRLIGNLSKGYQQRVGLAQAIIHRPPVIILDEPTVGLDPIQIREIRALISKLGEQHSLILSSHILPEIQATCTRVMIINQGQVVYADSMAAASAPRFDSLIMELSRPPASAALAAVPQVQSVDELGSGRFRLHCEQADDPREALAEAAHAGNWGLRELRAENKTLEEVFVELTTGEHMLDNETAGQEAA